MRICMYIEAFAVSASVVIIYKRGRIKVERNTVFSRSILWNLFERGSEGSICFYVAGRAAREEKEFASNWLPSFFLSSPRFARVTRAREQTSKVNLFLYRAKNTSKPRHCSRAPTNFLLTDRTYRKL